MNALKTHKGASFVCAAMCTAQVEKVDMLMYYDARPTAWNGIFGSYGAVYKPYYTFEAVRDIIALKNAAKCECDTDLYAIAANDTDSSALLLTYYNDDDNAADKTVKIEISGAKKGECVKAEFYLINETHDLELVREEYFTSDRFAIITKMKNYDVYFVKLSKESF